MLEILIVPTCFLVAGLIGYRLGTPARVAGGLVALGCAHLLAFLGSNQALAADGAAAAWIHLASQILFVAGFVAFVWLASVYPDQEASRSLIIVAGVLAAAGPLWAALSGPSPAIVDGTRELGPVVQLLPESWASFAVLPVMLLPALAVVTFVVRYRQAERDSRVAMRWPIAGLAGIASLVVAGSLLGSERQSLVTGLFLLAAPAFPLAIAFGPVARHLDSLSSDLAQLRGKGHRAPGTTAHGALARLTHRELTVLQAMAEGMSNPEIAKTLHLSLSSVEKHATSIFRKLEIHEAPATSRRVSAVVAYRDALEAAPKALEPS